MTLAEHAANGRSMSGTEERRRGTLVDVSAGKTYAAVLTRMSSVTKTRVEWIAPGRLAAGKLTILDGDPGLGKSTIALDWAARVSVGGGILGGDPRPPRGVILISDEDDLGDTTVPRLEAAGADLTRVTQLHVVDEEGNESIPEFPRHGDLLEAAADEIDAGLIVIDPIVTYLGADINSHRDADVRRALAPVILVAQRRRASVLILRHLNKSGGGSAIYRGGGSIGFAGVARLGMLVAKDPEDESGRTGVLATYKTNVGVTPKSLAYQLESVPGTDVARVRWLGESNYRADSLLEAAPSDEERGLRSEAEEFLLAALAGGSVETRDLQRMAKDAAIGWRTVERAKAKLKVEAHREGFGRSGRYVWRLPARAQASPAGVPSTADMSHVPPTERIQKPPENQPILIDRRQADETRAREGVWVCLGCGLPRSRDEQPCPNCGQTGGEER